MLHQVETSKKELAGHGYIRPTYSGEEKTKNKHMPVPSPQPASSPFFDEGIKLISYCPLCESSYNPASAKVLGEKEDSHLLHIRCGQCSNAIIALVLISTAGISSVGLVTDLAFEEVDRFKEREPVSTDDVIEVHHLLQNESLLMSALAV